ncbi:MAG: hypothetical protein IH831_06735 [Planctomycetes bacterium]|nr:hypothetical protein [Planctomycetota bacterium]
MASDSGDGWKPQAGSRDELAPNLSRKSRWQLIVSSILWGLWMVLLAWMAVIS